MFLSVWVSRTVKMCIRDRLYAVLPLFGLMLGTFLIGVVGIGIYHGAYMSEVVNSGLASVPKGQFEAAKSQGFTYWETMRNIILPQAIRTMLPPLAVQAANLIKNTSVLALIAGGELMYFSNSFAYSTSFYGPAYVVAGILYFILCFPSSRRAKMCIRDRITGRHTNAAGR